MPTEKREIIELPDDPFERASQAVAGMKALQEVGMKVLSDLENLDEALVTAANAVDASRGITIRTGAQMERSLSRSLAEIARDHAAVVSEFRKLREEGSRFAKSLRSVLNGLPKASQS